MASRRRRRGTEEPSPSQLELGAAIVAALRRLVQIEGSIAAVARSIAFRPSVVSGWLRRSKLPVVMLRDSEGLEQLLSVVYAQLAIWDSDSRRRGRRDTRIARTNQAGEIVRLFSDGPARDRAVTELEGWARRYGEIAKLRRLSPAELEWVAHTFGSSEAEQVKGRHRSGTADFARDLGVSERLLKNALAGRLTPVFWRKYQGFLGGLRAQARLDATDRESMEELLELAWVPEERVHLVERTHPKTKKKYTVRYVKHEPRPSDIRTRNYEFGGDLTSGWQWTQRIAAYAMPPIDPSGRDAWGLVEKMVSFVEGISLLDERRFPSFITKAVLSLLGEREDALGRRGNIVKSDPQTRFLEHPKARQFIVNNVHSSSECRGRGARERSLRRFIYRMGRTLDSSDLAFIQGVVGWQYRRRSASEQEARRQTRETRQILAERKNARLKKERIEKRKKQRARSRRLAGVMKRRTERKKQ